jgi:hypothetical protein
MKRAHLKRIAEGWEPFPFQLPNWRREYNAGYITTAVDERGHTVLVITDAGRDYVASLDIPRPPPRPMVEGDLYGHLIEAPELRYRRIYQDPRGEIRISYKPFHRKQPDPNDCLTIGWIVMTPDGMRAWVEK